MSDEDRLRRRLQRTLSAEPRPGMEGRVLDRMHAAPQRRGVLRPARAAALAGAALVAAGGLAVSAAALHGNILRSSPPSGANSAPQVATAGAPTSNPSGVSTSSAPSSTAVASSSSTSATGTATVVNPHQTAVPSRTPEPPSPTPAPPPPGTLVLTTSSNGQSFQVASGNKVWAVLPGDGQRYHGYTAPQSSDTAVLRADGASCSAPSGYFCTEFLAVSTGQAQLTATSDPACLQASPPCGAPSQFWRVNISAA